MGLISNMIIFTQAECGITTSDRHLQSTSPFWADAKETRLNPNLDSNLVHEVKKSQFLIFNHPCGSTTRRDRRMISKCRLNLPYLAVQDLRASDLSK